MAPSSTSALITIATSTFPLTAISTFILLILLESAVAAALPDRVKVGWALVVTVFSEKIGIRESSVLSDIHWPPHDGFAYPPGNFCGGASFVRAIDSPSTIPHNYF